MDSRLSVGFASGAGIVPLSPHSVSERRAEVSAHGGAVSCGEVPVSVRAG